MAKKHFLIPARLAKKYPLIRDIDWIFEAFIVKILVTLMRSMQPERAARFANRAFRTLKPVLSFAKKIEGNLRVAFPHKSDSEIISITRDACGNLGNSAAELILAERIWREREQRIEFIVEDGVDINKYASNPAVMVTGHIGAWQIATSIAAQYQLEITSVYAPEGNPYLRDYMVKLRSALPCRWVSRDGSMRGLMQELKNGHIVGLVSDTRLDSGNELPFFGVPTPTNTTAARLAIRHHCDLLPIRAERLADMHFRITLCRPIHPASQELPVAQQAEQMTARMLELFETWIREYPSEWMCFGRRWPHEAYAHISDDSSKNAA